MARDEVGSMRKIPRRAAPAVTYDLPLARRALRFVISTAAKRSFPARRLLGGQNVGEGYAYSFEDGVPMKSDELDVLTRNVTSIMSERSSATIERNQRSYADACAYFEQHGMLHSLALLRSRVRDPVDGWRLRDAEGGEKDEWRLALLDDGSELPPLSSLAPLRLRLHGAGFLALYAPDNEHEASPTLLAAAADHREWGERASVRSVGGLNALGSVGGRALADLVLLAEFRQESILSSLASQVAARCAGGDGGGERRVGVICIAGPTSSGKTTFANKLVMYLRNAGLLAKPLTVDHYYLPLDRQPKYQPRKLRSDVDYDAIESMDSTLVNEHINALLSGEAVRTPTYDMKTGYRVEPGVHFELPAGGLLVIEGIHALNPTFLSSVPPGRVFRVYISPISTLQLDEASSVKTTDHRLLRRMCRDFLFRGHSASRTLSMWANVRRGEHRWIFPHCDAVDFVVNSAMEYELGVLKPLLEPLLQAVPPTDDQHAKARALLRLLALCNPIPSALVPSTSLLREFIGDGAFDCH